MMKNVLIESRYKSLQSLMGGHNQLSALLIASIFGLDLSLRRDNSSCKQRSQKRFSTLSLSLNFYPVPSRLIRYASG